MRLSVCLPAATYAAAMTLLRPAVPSYLKRRVARGKEDPARLPERYGYASQPRPAGKLLWLHGASVGETASALPLVERLLAANPDLHILITSGTKASAEMLAKRLPARTLHQYIPLDAPAYARRFLDHWQPDAALWLESELWPNLLHAMQQRQIPALRLNARLTARSADGWMKVAGWMRYLQASFARSLCISPSDAKRLTLFAEPSQVVHAGNLKFTVPAAPVDSGTLAELKTHIGTRPVWLFANTHPGEDEIARAAHEKLARSFPHLLTVIVPRHPARADDIEMMLGGAVPRRSRQEWPRADQPYYLADSMGEMALFYRAIPVVCVGGSFTPKGGHNPLEAAQSGCATLIGPDTSKCEDIVAELSNAGALRKVTDAGSLMQNLQELLENQSLRTEMAKAGLTASNQQAQIMASILSNMSPILQPLGIVAA